MKSLGNITRLITVLGGFAMFAGCGGHPGTPPPDQPVPMISGIVPGFVRSGSAAQTLTINGTNFDSSSAVTLNNTEHAATLVSSSQLMVTLSAADQASSTCYSITVSNPAPGGGASNPAGFQVRDPASPIYVVDIDNHRVQVFDDNGNYVSQFDHSFDLPMGIAIDCQHNIYVRDGNTNCWVDKFDSNANFLLQFGQCLIPNGYVGPGVFDNASLLATDPVGNVWVPSADFFYVQEYDSSANLQSIVCMANLTGTITIRCPMATPFDVQPAGIAIDTVGHVLVSNINPGIAAPLVKFDSTGKYLSNFGTWGSGNGQFNSNIYPARIELAFDAQGNIYVTDPGNNRVQKFDSQGNYLNQFGPGEWQWTVQPARRNCHRRHRRYLRHRCGQCPRREVRRQWKLPEPIWLAGERERTVSQCLFGRCAVTRSARKDDIGLVRTKFTKERQTMLSRVIQSFVLVFFLIPTAISPLVAQEAGTGHHHYKLIDLGTLGGPQSFQVEESQSALASAGPAARMINSHGMVTGVADLNIADPYTPFCLSDCNVAHSFLWNDGAMTDLGALPGTNDSFANWINDRGEAAGASYNGVDPASGAPLLAAVLWKDGEVIDLGDLPGGNQSIANGMNDRGDVVGAAVNTTPDPFPNLWPILFFNNSTEARAVLWRHGAMTDLGTLGGPDSAAIFVNNFGQIAGQSLTNSTVNAGTGQPTQHPFLWQRGTMIDLGTLGGTLGFPTGLNNHGQVTGQMNVAGDINFHPFFWDRGSLTDLGTLGGDNAAASWINDSGEVLGISDMPGDLSWHAFIWKNGVMTDIGTPDGTLCSDPNVINSRGQAVGRGTDCQNHDLNTFLWENGSIVALESLVSPPSEIKILENISINDRGEIPANGVLPNGDFHAILLIPCDDDHANVDGCDYSMVESAGTAHVEPVRVGGQTTVTSNGEIHQRSDTTIRRLGKRVTH